MILYFYVALGAVALAYLLYLFVPKSKSWHLLGVAKKLRKILQANTSLQRNHTVKIAEAIRNIEALFVNGSGTDFVKLLNNLQKLKISNPELCPVIDLLLDKIKTERPYCLLSHDKEKAFETTSSYINGSNKDEALSALEVIYQQFVSIEDEYQRKGQRQFWIETALAIIGIILAIIPFLI